MVIEAIAQEKKDEKPFRLKVAPPIPEPIKSKKDLKEH